MQSNSLEQNFNNSSQLKKTLSTLAVSTLNSFEKILIRRDVSDNFFVLSFQFQNLNQKVLSGLAPPFEISFTFETDGLQKEIRRQFICCQNMLEKIIAIKKEKY